MPVLEISNLTKKYGKVTAVNNLSLSVQKGSIFGILGPNGSGKTTTLGVVTGITQPDNGSYSWFEGAYEGDKARQRIGTLLETPNFYPYLDAVKNLEIIAHIKKVKNPKIEALLDLVSLLDRKKSAFKTYSLGMKQRLAIAGAMIGDPDVLIFDEPTNGLDPQGIAEVRNTIKTIAAMDKTILMASHILDEVEKTCSHVAIIKYGHLLASGTVGAIINDDATVEVSASDLDGLYDALHSIDRIKRIDRHEKILELSVYKDFNTGELNRLAHAKGIVLTHLVKRQKSLESEFLEITKS